MSPKIGLVVLRPKEFLLEDTQTYYRAVDVNKVSVDVQDIIGLNENVRRRKFWFFDGNLNSESVR